MQKEQIEEWKPVKFIRPNGTILDFTGLYEASSFGRIRSLNYNRSGKIKVLSQIVCKGGDGSIYYQVTLYLDKKRYMLSTHRIVLSSFKDCEFFEGAVCDHIVARSETCCNNYLDNLHWVTQQQNTSTDRTRTLKSEKQLNDPKKSKRVCVKDLSTGEITEYPSAYEAERTLGLPKHTVPPCIRMYGGYYKKGNLMFSYI